MPMPEVTKFQLKIWIVVQKTWQEPWGKTLTMEVWVAMGTVVITDTTDIDEIWITWTKNKWCFVSPSTLDTLWIWSNSMKNVVLPGHETSICLLVYLLEPHTWDSRWTTLLQRILWMQSFQCPWQSPFLLVFLRSIFLCLKVQIPQYRWFRCPF